MTSGVEYRGRVADHGRGKPWTWRARQPVMPAVRATLRAGGMATVRWRPPPDFLVIGAKRGGSTSVYRNLVASPGVAPLFPRRAQIKGTYYFDVEYARGERWYRSHFPTALGRAACRDADGRPAITGEASPYYLSHPHAARRAVETVPEALIVVALRDPVRRAHSHYQERVRQGIEPIGSFAAAVEAEPERLTGEIERMADDPSYVSAAHLNFGYVAQSEYDEGLARWLAAYGSERVLVLRSEDFYADERSTLRAIRRFLGLADVELPAPRHYNDTGSDDLDPAVGEALRERLAPSVARLEALTGRSFGW